jgi:hypothetical protein
MLDTNESMTAKINVQAQIDNIWEIAGDAGLTSVAEALNAILARLGADTAQLTALDRNVAALSGISLPELAVQRARERSIEAAWAALTPDEATALRMFEGSSADPRPTVAAKRAASSELVALSSVARAEYLRRSSGDPIRALSLAKSDGLITP